MDIYRDAKRRGIYPPLFTDPLGYSGILFWIKKASSISSLKTFAKRRAIFLSVRKTVYIQVTAKFFPVSKYRKHFTEGIDFHDSAAQV